MKSGQEMYTSSHTLTARQNERLKEAAYWRQLAEDQDVKKKDELEINYLIESMNNDLNDCL